MVLNSKTLTNIPVRTRSGIPVGKLASIDLDSDAGKLAAIHVRVPGVVPRLMDNELIVPWAQVISIDEREVVIADGTIPIGATRLASQHTT